MNSFPKRDLVGGFVVSTVETGNGRFETAILDDDNAGIGYRQFHQSAKAAVEGHEKAVNLCQRV